MVLDDRLGLLVGRPRMWNAGKNWGGGLEWISKVPFIIKKSILSDLNESDVPET